MSALDRAADALARDGAEYSSAVIREARELIRERERAAGPMTRVQKLLWLEDNMTTIQRGTSRHDIAEILDLL